MGDGLSRRNLIKGAAAAGVGVAVWSTPSISAIAGTPTYAANCTTPFTFFTSGVRNVDCSCGSSSKFLDYHSPIPDFHQGTTASGPSVSGFNVALTSGADKACSDANRPVTVTSPGYDCEVCVVVSGSSAGTPPNGTYCSDPLNPALPQTPSFPGNACGSTKWMVQLKCVPTGSCFPQPGS